MTVSSDHKYDAYYACACHDLVGISACNTYSLIIKSEAAIDKSAKILLLYRNSIQ